MPRTTEGRTRHTAGQRIGLIAAVAATLLATPPAEAQGRQVVVSPLTTYTDLCGTYVCLDIESGARDVFGALTPFVRFIGARTMPAYDALGAAGYRYSGQWGAAYTTDLCTPGVGCRVIDRDLSAMEALFGHSGAVFGTPGPYVATLTGWGIPPAFVRPGESLFFHSIVSISSSIRFTAVDANRATITTETFTLGRPIGGSVTLAVLTTPEPSTWALMGTSLLTLGGLAARRRTRG